MGTDPTDGRDVVDQEIQRAIQEDPAGASELNARGARHYAARLEHVDESRRAETEERYMHYLQQRCESLIQQTPSALAAEIAAVPLALLQTPAHRFLVRYYRGLGAGLQDRFGVALADFDELLAEPELDDAVRGRVLNSAARFAHLQGDYERAQDGYRDSFTIWERLGNPLRQGLALNNRGILHYELQNYPAAEADFRSSARLFEETGATFHQARAYNELGLLYRDQGKFSAALESLTMAADLFEREGAVDFGGRVANNIGEVKLLTGDFDAAIACFDQALRQMRTRVYAVDVHLNRGLVAQAQGDDDRALEHYEAALALARDLQRRDVVALCHYRAGHAQQRLNRLDDALASYAAAINEIEGIRHPLRDEDLMISLMGRWQQVYEAAVQLCLLRGDAPAAFAYAERARARAFADVLARRGAEAPLVGSIPVTAAEVQAALPPRALLLAYFATGLRGDESALFSAIPREAAGLRACLITPPRTLLFAVSASGIQSYDCKLDPNALRSPQLQDGRRFLAPRLLQRAFTGLLGPVADLIDRAGSLVVVPHGPLHQMPFAALVGGGQPLLERSPKLCYAPSATLVLRTLALRPAAAPEPCLALGYDGAERGLRQTEPEAAAIAALCGGSAWRGTAGVCARLRDQADRYRWLHLACHGEFDLDDPLRSWLEVGPGERLTAADVMEQWTLRADLVTLSACHSGISRVLRGDEPMGLVRAFLSAGARAVLVSLWPVEDTSARMLMERFYALMLGPLGRDPAAALREAQRYLRALKRTEVHGWLAERGASPEAAPGGDDDLPVYADPFFWAPYALVGGL